MKLCFILLAYEDELYTNIDLLSPSRADKMRLLGEDPGFAKYHFKDLEWIQGKCDGIILFDPMVKVARYTFAFEEVYKRIKDIDKLYFYEPLDSFDINTRFPGRMRGLDYKEDTKRIATEYFELLAAETRRLVHPSYMWINLFMRSYNKLFPLEEKIQVWNNLDNQGLLENSFQGLIHYNHTSYLFWRQTLPDLLWRLKDFGILILNVLKNTDDLTMLLYEAYDTSNGAVTPIRVGIGDSNIRIVFIYEPGADIEEVINRIYGMQILIRGKRIIEPGHNLRADELI